MYFSSRKFKPLPVLQRDVKCFWVLEAEANAHNSMPVLPDTNIELIITCGAPFVVRHPDGSLSELPPVYLTRLHNRPQYPQVVGDCQFIAVRLYPWAVRNLADVPANIDELPFIPLNQHWQGFAKSLTRILRQKGCEEAVNCLQEFVIQNRQPQSNAQSVQSAGTLLHQTTGQININALAAQCNLSLRQFERQFKHWTGILPKAYARLIRYESARTALYDNPWHSMGALAQDFGYTDQAHFIHEFRTYTGCTPGEFAARIQNTHNPA